MKKAIKTVYDGLNFRSRTEAAWYAFFQMLGYEVEYEPECFEIDIEGKPVNYLPDFKIKIKDFRYPVHFEIKSQVDGEVDDIKKVIELCRQKDLLGHVVVGWPRQYCATFLYGGNGNVFGAYHDFMKAGTAYGFGDIVVRPYDIRDKWGNNFTCVTQEKPIKYLPLGFFDRFNVRRDAVEYAIANAAWNATQWRGGVSR